MLSGGRFLRQRFECLQEGNEDEGSSLGMLEE